MSIKKNIFAPLATGLGAMRRAAMTLLLALLTTVTAWATTTSTITVGGTDYTLFTGFTATGGSSGTGVYTYEKMVDGDVGGSSSFHDFSDVAYVEFNSDEPIIPKGYIVNLYNFNSFSQKPNSWVLKAKANTDDEWAVLSSYSGQNMVSEQQYACNNDGNTPYKYFRFEASNTNKNIWLTEIRLYGSSPDVYYTHLTKKDATCTETGIKQDCYLRNDGKYFTDETGTTELAESDVIDPIKPHTGVHHEATDVNIEYWQCSMCSKYFSNEGCTTEITEEETKIYRTITIDGSISGLVTSNVNQALAGATVTLTVSHLIDASTLKVNNGAVELTDNGSNHYTFTVPAADVTVTAETLSTYSFSLPDNMEIVSATNEADGNGKYISGTVITFAPSLRYSASNVSDGTNTLEPDANGVYTVTIENANINITATVVGSSTLYLPLATSDLTVADGETLVGSTSHTVTIANGANITLNNATITGGIVCEGTATITLVGTNSVSGWSGYDSNIDAVRYSAGIQIGGSGTTLTINGNGTLTANGAYQCAGIGLSRAWNVTEDVIGGNIVINGGTITATGGESAAGIGTGIIKNNNNDNSTSVQFGTITIKGGSVMATGGSTGDGIGKGYSYYGPTITIGTVTIYDGIDKVDASSIKDFANVVYKHVDGETETDVTASKTDYFAIGEDGDRRLIVQKPVIAEIADQTYTGSAITPEPLVIAGSLSLTKGEDYTYSYENNTNVGTATVRATFQGTYASLGYVEKTFTIKPSTIMVNVTGGGTVTIGDKSASDGEAFGVMSEKGASVVLTLAPASGNAVRSVAYGYTNSSDMTMNGAKLPITDGTATLTVPNDLKDGTGVTLTVTFAAALVGGADEASAVALADATVTDLAGGWYKVESDITFDHTLNLLGDTHLIIADSKTMTVNTASGKGIDSDYTLTVGGAGALSVTASGSNQIAVRVGNYVQTGATVTASGFIGIRCCDDFDGNVTNAFTFSGGQLTATGTSDGIRVDNTITLSCTNASDFIQSSSYDVLSGGTIKVADGKALTDGTEASNGMNGYSGTLTDEQRTAIGGKTLHRAVTTSYVEASGTLHENVIAIPLDNTMTTLAAGWYVVNENVDYTGQITLSGDVKLILGDGCTMSFGKEGEPLNATIIECNFKNLTIYGQSGGTGWLKAYSAQDDGIHVNNYTQYSGNVLIFDGNGACIYANNSVTLLGGTLDVENGGGGGNGDIYGGTISILGGKLWARNKGLWSPEGITLGYTNTTDQIKVTIYHAGGMGLQIADGKTLVDDYGTIWSGTLNNNQIEHDINGRTLRPLDYTGVTLTGNGYNVSATFDGTSTTTVSIPVDVNVTSVTYNRTFTDGKPSTVMLPFNKAVSEIGGGTFYTFGGVEKKNNKWEATMNEVTGSLTANTPYLFVPAGTSLTFTGGATLNTTGGGNCLASDTEGWEFHGTYERKVWDEAVTHDYGFAATSGTSADNQDVEAGQFVRLTTGASAKPMRCYLSYVGVPNQARALTRGAAATDEELPQSIIVRLVGANGQTTGIGTIDTKTGEMTFDSEAWYTLDGVRLSGKPTKKGLYINNGKKIVIK